MNHNLINVADIFPKPKPKPQPRDNNSSEDHKPQAEEDIYIGHAWFESQTAEVYTSRFNWETMGENEVGFRLRLIGSEIQIQKDPRGWFPVLIEKNGQQSLLYDQPLTIEFAMGIAEEKVREYNFDRYARKDAPWRAESASSSQRDALRKWGIPILEDLTKNQADQILRDLIKEK